MFGPDLGDQVYVGLFVCAAQPDGQGAAVFSNVRIVVPPKAGWVPYRDYIGSNLEVMDIRTGARTVVHTSPISIQAPNWTPDGKTLIFNGSGKLYVRPRHAGRRRSTPASPRRNNNDHVLSFDGTMLGISSHSRTGQRTARSSTWCRPPAASRPA